MVLTVENDVHIKQDISKNEKFGGRMVAVSADENVAEISLG